MKLTFQEHDDATSCCESDTSETEKLYSFLKLFIQTSGFLWYLWRLPDNSLQPQAACICIYIGAFSSQGSTLLGCFLDTHGATENILVRAITRPRALLCSRKQLLLVFGRSAGANPSEADVQVAKVFSSRYA